MSQISENDYQEIKRELRKTIENLKRAINLIDYQENLDSPLIVTLNQTSQQLLENFTVNKSSLKNPANNQNNSKNRNKKNNNIFSLNTIISFALVLSLSFNFYTLLNIPKTKTIVPLNENIETTPLIENQILPEENTENKLIEETETNTLENNNINEEEEINIEIISKEKVNKNETLIEVKEEIDDDKNIEKEDELLITIQQKITNITDEYQENLIIKIKANYQANNLLIIVNNDWYKLAPEIKKEISQKIFNQIKTIDFYHFQIQDKNQNLLVRNPIIGDRPIIINTIN